MTIAFNQHVVCPKCGHSHTSESEFQRWIRGCKELQSNEGFVVSDFDYIFHRYKTLVDGRKVQCIMFCEVKTNGARVSSSQSKTLSMARQIMQTRGLDYRRPHFLQDGPGGPMRLVWCFGGFELSLSGQSPETSSLILWHRKEINVQTLVKIFRFDINPLTLKPMDWRRNHHPPDTTPSLFKP